MARFNLTDNGSDKTAVAGQTFLVRVRVQWDASVTSSAGNGISGIYVHFSCSTGAVLQARIIDRNVQSQWTAGVVVPTTVVVARVLAPAAVAGTPIAGKTTIVAQIGAIDSNILSIDVYIKEPSLWLCAFPFRLPPPSVAVVFTASGPIQSGALGYFSNNGSSNATNVGSVPSSGALDLHEFLTAWVDVLLGLPNPNLPSGNRGYVTDPLNLPKITLTAKDAFVSLAEVDINAPNSACIAITSAKSHFPSAGGRTATITAQYNADTNVKSVSVPVTFADFSSKCMRDNSVTILPWVDPVTGASGYGPNYHQVPVSVALEYDEGYGVTPAGLAPQVGIPGIPLPFPFRVKVVDDTGYVYKSAPDPQTPTKSGGPIQVSWTAWGPGGKSGIVNRRLNPVANPDQWLTTAISDEVVLTPDPNVEGPWFLDVVVSSGIYDANAPNLDDGSNYPLANSNHRSTLGAQNIYRFVIQPMPKPQGVRPIYRIHPGIGVARLGNNTDPLPNGDPFYFVGPEPGWKADDATTPSAYKCNGKVRPQAARFRIWEYAQNATGQLSPVREVKMKDLTNPTKIVDIQWTVHLANRKASFYKFGGPNGESAEGSPEATVRTAVLKRNSTYTSIVSPTTGLQINPLDIDPLPRTVSAYNTPTGPAGGNPFSPGMSDAPLAESWPLYSGGPNNGDPVINYLGELEVEDTGRLLVIGGRGKSDVQFGGVQTIDNYGNNDLWFDDISDGPVTAVVFVQSDNDPNPVAVPVTTEGEAWVLVTPPDFAPAIRNVVTLYDVLLDVTARCMPPQRIPDNVIYDGTIRNLNRDLYVAGRTAWGLGARNLTTFVPNWADHIQPLFDNAALLPYVHAKTLKNGTLATAAGSPAAYHTTFGSTMGGKSFSDPTAPAVFRATIASYIRPPLLPAQPPAPALAAVPPPGAFAPIAPGGPPGMPRAYGDAYSSKPWTTVAPRPRDFLSVTPTQYMILTAWYAGNFTNNPSVMPSNPFAYDKAALERCVGGAFYPGIEVSWQIRQPSLFLEPFRLNHDAVSAFVTPLGAEGTRIHAGHFSRQMAIPWQADFADCEKGRNFRDVNDAYQVAWWPAQRPDDVYHLSAAPNSYIQDNWSRSDSPFAPGWLNTVPMVKMVQHWYKFGFVVASNAPPPAAGNPPAPPYVESERNKPLP